MKENNNNVRRMKQNKNNNFAIAKIEESKLMKSLGIFP